MCGIFGEFIYKGKFDIERYISRLNLLTHRGPDGYGFEYGNFFESKYNIKHNSCVISNDNILTSKLNYFMGHRRLSILDLSENAFQPMESADQRYSIIFNGEIYNYIELKKELIKKGCKFKTDHSDTEVLLNAYIIWGTRCLKKLRGMFAFAIFDKPKSKIFIARDRIGQKPIFYEETDERFVFASEIGPIIKFVDNKRNVNREALNYYLAFGYVPNPISIFEGINKLPPATYLEYDLIKKSILTRKYWDLEFTDEKQHSEEYFLNEIEKLLDDSVYFRLRSDVPLGAFVSGGTDSTLIIKKVNELENKRIEIFGADFPQPEQSERKYIEQVAEKYEQNLNISNIDLSHVSNIPSIVGIFDEPFDGGSSVALFDLFKNAKNKCKVILTGDGGDEVFAGYMHYVNFYPQHKKFKTLEKVKIIEKALSTFIKFGIKNKKVEKLKQLIQGDFLYNYFLLNSNLELVNLAKNSKNFEPEQLLCFDAIKQKIKNCNLSPLKALQYLDLNSILPDRMLYKLDRFSMYYGIEARSPFLDHNLIEKAFMIPDKYHVRNGRTKVLLKKLLEKDFAHNFVYRKKQGFGNPLSYWFNMVPAEIIFKNLLNKKSDIFKLLEFKKVHQYFPQIKSGYSGSSEKQLWRLVVLGRYLEDWKNFISYQ